MSTSTLSQLSTLPSGIKDLTDDEMGSLLQRFPWAKNFFPKGGICVTCKGKRTFLWQIDGRPTEFACPCIDQFSMYLYFTYCGIGLSYQRLGWDDTKQISDDHTRLAMDYLTQEGYLDAGFGLVLSGGKGTGKTLLANLIVKQLLAQGVTCYATTFADMVNNFMGTWRDRSQEKWFTKIIRNAGVLYIDDLSREYKPNRYADAAMSDVQRQARDDNRPGNVAETMLEGVIRHRVANSQPTIITTNFTKDQIFAGYGGHTMSLLSERSEFIEVTGPDRRDEMQFREREYIKAGMTRPLVVG